MLRCFELANMGKFAVSPNPRVGAVIVHKGKVIGEGYHQKFGEAHAEVNAINSVKNQALLKESELYVNLEPCSHFGKTPPCSDLIIEKGVPRVIIANKDPFDSVNGSGIDKLKKAGIEVIEDFLAEEGREVNKRFFCFHQKKRPYIILKWAKTKDGFISRLSEDPEIEDNWISNAKSKQLVHSWRAEEDGILVGKNTVLNDDPALSCREVEGKDPVRIVLDSKLQINPNFKVLKPGVKTIIINQLMDKVDHNLHYLKTEDIMEIKSILSVLYEQGIQSVLVEGGAKVLNGFIKSNLWDEARVFTGDKYFNQGILAPKMDMEAMETLSIDTDQLQIYRNVSI